MLIPSFMTLPSKAIDRFSAKSLSLVLSLGMCLGLFPTVLSAKADTAPNAKAATALSPKAATAPSAKADIIIYRDGPIIIYDQDHTDAFEDEVLVDFIAAGTDWANVSLDGRRVFSARTFNRRQQLALEPGAYYLKITGSNRFEVWATGYLDVGRDHSNVLVVNFSRDGGVRVAGDPYAWIPDGQ